MRKPLMITLLALVAQVALGAEYHVSPEGSEGGDGSAARPFRAIQAAAEVAQPGDVITVQAGVYRERINPPRGGESDARRITYQAAPGGEVVIKGSEVVKGWEQVEPKVWKVTLPNSFFGDYNPYQELITGDWFQARGRSHHTGEVYLNGRSLYEKATLAEVLEPQPFEESREPEWSVHTWYCESDEESTTIWANFQGADPNAELVEINVREACFYPDQPGRNYITVRGFRMAQAATQWAAPTAEQIGLIGTHWSKGWVIENNVISDSKCSGVTLGKDRASGHNVRSSDPAKSGAEHYNDVIARAIELGWSEDLVGWHVVRGNEIYNCEQTGICGSLGAIFSRITDNHIHDVWIKRQFQGAEIAGIKLHAPIDTLIAGNRIHNVGRGLWMDWMSQGTRVTRNLLYNNTIEDIYFEVNHGPYVVDNNIMLSWTGIKDASQGGAWVHNLVAGRIWVMGPGNRRTPYHKPHSAEVVAHETIKLGDTRYYNNLFIGEGPGAEADRNRAFNLGPYYRAELPIHTGGNIYLNGASARDGEEDALVMEDDPRWELIEDERGGRLALTLPELPTAGRQVVTTELLGRAMIPDQPFMDFDGTPLVIGADYFGAARGEGIAPGPFARPEKGRQEIELWRN